jgi:hypothetical protein
MWRVLVPLLCGCLNQAARIVSPAPEGGGTLSCREIVETCDSACTQPLCLHGCTNQGTAEAQQLHGALLGCGERNGCTDEVCMRASCAAEIDACQGPPPPEAPAAPPT